MSITAGLVLNELHMYLLSVSVCRCVAVVHVHNARGKETARKNTEYNVYMIRCVCVSACVRARLRQLRDDKWTDNRSR